MSTTISNDLATFHAFIGQQLAAGNHKLTPEESVTAYRSFLQEREHARREIAPALEQSKRGETKVLDYDAMMQRVERRLADEGIVD